MEENDETYNGNENNLDMEVEVITTDTESQTGNGTGISQNETLPIRTPSITTINTQPHNDFINLQQEEITLSDVQNDPEVIIIADRSPQIYEDNASSQNDNISQAQESNMPKNDEPSSKKLRLSCDADDDNGSTCSICLDNWTNTGDHRICSLKCGHLFGLSCIKRWIEMETRKQCPTCKRNVNLKRDIRYIYAKKLIAVDTFEIEQVRQHLQETNKEKNRIQIELTRCLCRERLLSQELEDYKKKVKDLTLKLEVREQYSLSQNNKVTQKPGFYVKCYMDKSLELSREGGCRVLDYKSDLDLVVVSMKSFNNFFSGYGVRKISLSNYKPTGFVGLHSGVIRDFKFHAQKPLLLSVSLDKTVKVLDINSNGMVASVTSTCPLWSCCWHTGNPHMFYIGEQQGSVLKYDMRQTSEPIATLSVPGDMSPVVSLAGLEQDDGLPVSHGGVISCKLNSIWIFEDAHNEFLRHNFPIEGPFVSMSYQNYTKQMLVSSRPNTRTTFARHVVCTIGEDQDSLRCDTIHCFPAGPTQKLLSRSCFLSNKQDLIAAYQENQRCVNIWSINTGQKVCSVPAHEPVLDICGIETDSANMLVNLTEKKVEFFKFTN